MAGSSTDVAVAKAKAAAPASLPAAKAASPVLTTTKVALAQLVSDLEEARKNDVSGDVKRLAELKRLKEESKKETKRLQAEQKKEVRKRKAILLRTSKASTDDLLEALRHRMSRNKSSTSTEETASTSAAGGEEAEVASDAGS